MANRLPYAPRLPGIDDIPEEPGFRGPQVCEIVGITYRQLDYWARTGLLVPSISDAKGSGTQRRYSYGDLVELKVIKQLIDGGISLQRSRQALECLRSVLDIDLASANLVLAGTSSVLARSSGEVVDLLKGGQGVFNVVPLDGLVEELDASIVQIGVDLSRAKADRRPQSDSGANVYVADSEVG